MSVTQFLPHRLTRPTPQQLDAKAKQTGYLQESGIFTLEDLESRVKSHRTTVDGLKETLDSQTARMKEIRRLYDYADTYKRLKPVFDGLQKIKFNRPREKYRAEHADELKMF